MATDITLHQAMQRSHQGWDLTRTHVDVEQAFLDRTLMAAEITTLREELAATKQALDETEQEVRDLSNQLANIDFE